MKTLFYKNDTSRNKMAFCHLLAFLCSLPFDRFYSTLVLASFAIHALLYLKKEDIKKIGMKTFILQSVFFVTATGAIYSVTKNGGDILTRQLAIFLFPVLFSLLSLALNRYRERLMLGFSMCCTLVIAYLFFDALHVIHHNGLELKTLASAAFLNQHFSEPLSIHATYLSLYVLMSLVFVLHALFSRLTFWKRVMFIFSSVILLAGLIQLGSRAVCIAFLVVINSMPLFLVQGKRKFFILLIIFLLTLTGILLISSFSFLKGRFMTDLRNDFEERANVIKNDTRRQRWEASYDLIRAAPVAGYGSGAETPLLKKIYFDRKMYSSYLNDMNVHNQYLSFLINSGIIGLAIYVFTLGWGFRYAIIQKDVLLFSFLAAVAVVSFSENLLAVNKGIFFYAFFFPFLIFSSEKRKFDRLNIGDMNNDNDEINHSTV